MCGIVGVVAAYANGFTTKEAEMFQVMLFLDMLRGADSTGAFVATNKNNVHIRKSVQNGWDFQRTPEFANLRTKMITDGMFAVGHNRAATRGAISDKNAHPFWEDDKIVMVHNGTWKGSHNHHKNTEVDSEVICHYLATKPTVEEALQSVNAAYALAWYNVGEKSLNLIRNEDRPLWIVTLTTGAIAFCSEPETIMYSAHKAGFKIKDKIVELEPGVHHKFVLDTDKKEYERFENKLDIAYRSKSFPATVYHPQFPRNDNVGDEDYGCMYGGFTPRETSQRPEVVTTKPSERQVTDINRSFSDVALKNLQEKFIPHSVADEISQPIWEHLQEKHVVIELEDYFPSNSYKGCRSWFVCGSIIAPSADTQCIADPIVAYWFVMDKSEEEIMEYVNYPGVYTGVLGSIIRTRTLTPNNEGVSLMTAFVRDVKVISVTTKEEASVH